MVNINTPVRELYFEINSKQFKTIGELKNFIKDYIPADFNVEFYGRSEFKIYYKDPYYKGFHFYINRYSNYYEVYAEPNFGVYYKWNNRKFTMKNTPYTYQDLMKFINRSANQPKQDEHTKRFLAMKESLKNLHYYEKTLNNNEVSYQRKLEQLEKDYQWTKKYYSENLEKTKDYIKKVLKGEDC